MWPTLKSPGRVVTLVVLAGLLNWVPIELPGGAWFFFGPFLSMPLVLVLPGPWAVLAAAVPAAVTMALLGHPFLLVLAVLEAGWLVALRPARWRSSLFSDAVFWALLGGPLIYFFNHRIARVTDDVAAVEVVKVLLNQLLAVAIGSFLARHTRLGHGPENGPNRRARVREVVFRFVVLLVVVPLAFLGVAGSALARIYLERIDREVLLESAQRVARQMDLFLATHEASVASIAGALNRGGADATVLLEETRRTHPAFITMLVADASGLISHAAADAPTAGLRNQSVADREYFQQVRETGRSFVSGVFRGRGFGNDLIVAISAPLRGPGGEFAGIVQASLEVSKFATLVAAESKVADARLLLVDRYGRVIYADSRAGVPTLARLRHYEQGVLLDPRLAAQRVEFDDRESAERRVRDVGFAARTASGVVVITQRPLLSALAGVGWIFGLIAVLVGGIVGVALWVARATQSRVAVPLEVFARAASRQAAQQSVEPIRSPSHDAPQEIAMVYSAFNNLAVKLSGTYLMLRKQNEELDRRVVERTKELEGARAEAVAASESKSVFLAMTSHEIRTPLNAIIGLADALEEKAPDRASGDRLRTIKHAGRRLLSVVNDLLDLSRVEAGKLELRPAPLELGALCEELRGLFGLRAEQLGLALTLVPPPGGAYWIEADGARLQQVLVNLIGNAMKFTKTGGITLRIEIAGETGDRVGLRFSVIDTGPGIAAEEQARLFQPYVQLPSGETSAMPGTGLGLAICNRLVGLLGGALGVRSEVGRGAEFFFAFQARRCAAPLEKAPAPPDARTAKRAHSLRILAADDNEANREVLSSLLEAHCARLVLVDSAQAAIDALLREPFDVALIDLEMIDADGYSVARTVRGWQADEASRGCRLIAFSAHSRDQRWAGCAEAGFDDYVEKPIDRAVLMASVRARSDRGV